MTHNSTLAERSHRNRRLTAWMRTTALVVAAGATALIATSASATSVNDRVPRAVLGAASTKLALLKGVPDPNEPSGMAPPVSDAMPGYVESYVQDFNGHKLPVGWSKFAGVPHGTVTSYWAPSHVLQGGGMVRLVTYRDPRHDGRWVSGGICQCAVKKTYGAYFIRSRLTGPGPDEDELLWPAANVWPPEVDFNETAYSAHSTSWTVHFGSKTAFAQGTHAFNLERWHTWGVIWTPTSVVFTIDGAVWGEVTHHREVPQQAMTLDIDQEARCVPGLSWAACPVHKVSMLIDWVAEFTKS
jgi:Glycosyl hydrolases family 16